MTEYASHRRGGSFQALTQTLAQAPPEIVRSINAKRRAAGLIPVPTRGNPRAKLTPRRPTTTMPMPRKRQWGPATAAQWAGLRLDASIVVGRLRMNLRN
jgi:hypothetical protein